VKLAPIAKAARDAGVEHVIVHTGQHYDPMLSDTFFCDLGIPTPDVNLNVGSGSHGVQTGQMLAALDPVLEDYSPNWVLVYGDTNSTLAAALSAVKMHLPVAHLEAGLRSFNRRMPEEHNRVVVDHVADLLLAPTSLAAQNLKAEGLESSTVIVGDVMVDVLLDVRDKVIGHVSRAKQSLGLSKDNYYVATIHRADNTDDPARLSAILDALGSLDKPSVLLVHPRLAVKATAWGMKIGRGNLHEHPALAYPDLVAAVLSSAGVVTDSGGLQKEAFLLRVPCTTVRTETEWSETVDCGWNVLAHDPGTIPKAVMRPIPPPTDATPYGDGHAAQDVIKALAQHSDVSSGGVYGTGRLVSLQPTTHTIE